MRNCGLAHKISHKEKQTTQKSSALHRIVVEVAGVEGRARGSSSRGYIAAQTVGRAINLTLSSQPKNSVSTAENLDQESQTRIFFRDVGAGTQTAKKQKND